MSDKTAIVIPVRNEEACLERNIGRLRDFLVESGLAESTTVIIADNGSTDSTGLRGRELADRSGGRIVYHFVEQRGKGAAIKDAWRHFAGYDVYAFMDVDLSTDLASLPGLIGEAARCGGMAIGSRYLRGSLTKRGLKREVISWGYRRLFSLFFRTGIRDPQCGFKAIDADVRSEVVPRVRSDGFFFDTELLIRTIRAGFDVVECPVQWAEGTTTSVRFLRDVPVFLSGLARLKWEGWKEASAAAREPVIRSRQGA